MLCIIGERECAHKIRSMYNITVCTVPVTHTHIYQITRRAHSTRQLHNCLGFAILYVLRWGQILKDKYVFKEVLMYRYNNKTYRIDDIDWDHNPTFEFETRRGKITMMAYYKEVSTVWWGACQITLVLNPLSLIHTFSLYSNFSSNMALILEIELNLF